MSYVEALTKVTSPGEFFEVTKIRNPDGTLQEAFLHAPKSLREVFKSLRDHGESTALVFGEERYSYNELIDQANGISALLLEQFGITTGDRVAIAMRNYPEWIMAFIGITSIGATCVPLNSLWTSEELAYAIGDCEPSLVFADERRTEFIEETAQARQIPIICVRAEDDSFKHSSVVKRWEDIARPGPLPDVQVGPQADATLLYTSGTTGNPKGAVSTHHAVIHALWGGMAFDAIASLRIDEGVSDQTKVTSALLGIPLFHVTGCISVMLSSLVGGLKLVIMDRWNPEDALRLIEAEQVSVFIGVPTQSFDLMNHPKFEHYDTSSMQWIGGGGASTPPALLSQIRQRFVNAMPSFGYGMTETNALGPSIYGKDAYENPESVGYVPPTMKLEIHDPVSLTELPIGDVGEIWLSGPQLVRGYWNQPEATAHSFHNGFLRTGDIGRVDDAGLVYISDRIKDLIIRGGENVYCAEVEKVIYEHPDVLEAAVYGVPHPRLGEEVAATVVMKPQSTENREGFTSFLSNRLAAFKIPSILDLRIEPLPRNASGKFIKTQLRDEYLNSI